MTMTSFQAGETTQRGYLAVPTKGQGKGVLVLHAWWGLTEVFTGLCDRLADNGFVAFAPDLHQGRTAETIAEAEHLLESRDSAAAQATAEEALRLLQNHPAVQGEKLGAVGFSMGAGYALLLDDLDPGAFGGIVLFYGGTGADLSRSQAQFQLHFAEEDDWEPIDEVKKMDAPNAELYIYPDAYHWFFEGNKPEHFKVEAAELAWERMLAFLKKTI